MKTITIIAKVNGYKCKLLIDENSEGLELGTHELLVNDDLMTILFEHFVIIKSG